MKYREQAAPRKWGYTADEKTLKLVVAGCPAQVGIHPVFPSGKRGRIGLPRASGDTPPWA